jgi:ElaB/YqjD/DUF883 family membrane-anchored ribosome-binding protein
MRDQSFAPLAVETEKAGQYRIVRTLTEAADMLLNRWPEQKGQKHRKALSAIMDAIEERTPAVAARKAFVAAAKEADVFVREPA